ncbi:MAG: YciI family protein [Anaerolineae bacterium]|nr:YciI family protein [Anaerolineae bacterium]
MQYMFLIYGDETAEARQSADERAAVLNEYFAFAREARQRGMMLAGDELQATRHAKTVRKRDGKLTVTTGPFAETREQLGGFFVLDCQDLDEALDMARKIPAARHGAVEVRPITTYERR